MKKYLLVAVALVVFLGESFAQDQAVKIGYTDADQVLAALPQSKQIETDLKAYQTQVQNEMQSKMQEFEQKYKKYQAEVNDYLPSIREQREKELQSMQQNLQEFERQAQADLQKKNGELLAPVYEKIQGAINEIAKAEGFTYIFSSSASGFPILLYADEKHDITNKVITKLGGKPLEKKEDKK